jgi:hypothetical protein
VFQYSWADTAADGHRVPGCQWEPRSSQGKKLDLVRDVSARAYEEQCMTRAAT